MSAAPAASAAFPLATGVGGVPDAEDVWLSGLEDFPLRALMGEPHWGGWTAVDQGGEKPSKVPTPKSNESWWPYEEALAKYRNGGGYSGLAFHGLRAGRDMIDGDHCVNPETGELAPWARVLIDHLAGAYWERTPSGTGIRIIGARSDNPRFLQIAQPESGGEPEAELINNYTTITFIGSGNPDTDISKVIDHLLMMYPKGEDRGAKLDATAEVVAQHYAPAHERHYWCLAAAGLLRCLGVTHDEASTVFERAAGLAGDSNAKDRRLEVRTTYERPEDSPITGARKLIELMGDEGRQLGAALRKLWRGDFARSKGQIVASSLDNIRLAFEKLGVAMSYDEFKDEMYVTRAGRVESFTDGVRKRLWVEVSDTFGFRPQEALFETVMETEALANTFHPVRDYLAKLKWDGVKRIDTWLIDYGKARDTELTRVVGAIVLVAAVRRVRQPGCKFDEMLILENPEQGTEKSTAIEALCPDPNYFSDSVPLHQSPKRLVEATLGVWIGEVGELAGFTTAKVEHLKQMLSCRSDGPVRMAYAHKPERRPRQFIVLGTTNGRSYLLDTTGNRRYWPVRVGRLDAAAIARDRDQLWAEAATREAAGASIRLPKQFWNAAAHEQEARRAPDPWEEVLEAAFRGSAPGTRLPLEEPWLALGTRVADGADSLKCVAIPVERRDQKAHDRVIAIMSRLGFRKKVAKVRGSDNRATARQWCLRGLEDDE